MLIEEMIVFCNFFFLKVNRNVQPTCVDGANGSFIGHAVEMYFINEDKWYPRKLADFNYATSGEYCQSNR